MNAVSQQYGAPIFRQSTLRRADMDRVGIGYALVDNCSFHEVCSAIIAHARAGGEPAYVTTANAQHIVLLDGDRRLREIYRHTYTRNDRRRYLLGRVRARLRSFSYSIALRKGLEEAVSAPRDVKEINHTAGVNYNLRPYPGRVTLFRAEEDHPMVKPLPLDLGWSSFAHSLAIKHIPGDHGGILYDPGLSILAAELTGTLEDANAAFDEAVPLEQAAQNTGRIVMEL